MSEAPREVLQIDLESPGDDGTVSVALTGELDLVSAKTFGAAVTDLRRAAPSRVLIDLSGLTFVDSSGINALVQAVRSVEADGGTAALVAPSPATRRIFEIARVVDIVEVVDTPDVALVDHGPAEACEDDVR